MHSIVRQIHLYSALVLLAFVLMYFVTGYVLTRQSWFGEPQSAAETRRVALDAAALSGEPGETAFAMRLQNLMDLAGKPAPARRLGGGRWEFSFHKPGYNAKAVLDADRSAAEITETRHGWQRVMIGFHRLHGYGGGWLYILWAIVYDVASLSMIAFAVSGVWLWHGMTKNRLAGWIVLAAGFAYTAGVILAFLYLP